MLDLTHEILDQLPPPVRFTAKEAETISRHREVMLTWEDGLIDGFYNIVFAHDTTRQVFNEGERPAREDSLRNWYRETINGTFDERYWQWHTLVGLLHIKRRVNNAMVSGMWGWIVTYLSRCALEQLSKEDALDVITAVHALQASVMALIAESYQRNIFTAVEKAAGLNEALLFNLVDLEIDKMVGDFRR